MHSFLSNSRLFRPSRSSYKHIYARINAYKNSIIPYLARFLTNKQKVRDKILSFIQSSMHYIFSLILLRFYI